VGLKLVMAGALVSGACSSSVPLDVAPGSAGVGGVGGGAAGDQGAAGRGEAGSTDAGADGLADAASEGGCLTLPSWPTPDPFITSGDATSSSCGGKTLQQVIDAVHASHPELADIARIFSPDPSLDGSFIYAFAAPMAFRLVFVRGSGDCPSGCIERDYWYFQTDASCTPVLVGNHAVGACPPLGDWCKGETHF
jgi:hypothetical protein